jgi:hypothetical protein
MSESNHPRIQIKIEHRALTVTIHPRPMNQAAMVQSILGVIVGAILSSLMLLGGYYFWQLVLKNSQGIRGGNLVMGFFALVMLFWLGRWLKKWLITLWKPVWQLTGSHKIFVSANIFTSTRQCCGFKREKIFHLPDIKHLHVMRDEELTQSMDVTELLLDNSYLSYQERGVFKYLHFEMSVGELSEIFSEIRRLLPGCCQLQRN